MRGWSLPLSLIRDRTRLCGTMTMKPFFDIQPLEQVWTKVYEVQPLESERIPLNRAAGRSLAEDFCAPCDLPGFDRSTMDGYAVRARDTFGASEGQPGYLDIVGDVVMGQVPDFSLRPGKCARIGTGGMLPEGADAVIMVEHTSEVDSTAVELTRSVAPGTHVIRATDDAERGQRLLLGGRRLRPQDIGLLAALGEIEPTVFHAPRVGLISTGDEVIPVEQEPRPGQVRDVNTHALAALVRAAGGVPIELGLVPDDREELLAVVKRSHREADVTLLSGGSSVGSRDLTAEVFQLLPEAELLVHGVSVAPGKPFIWVRAGTHQLLGLPGQVTSCTVAFHLFAEPLMERMQGRRGTAFSRFGRVRAKLTRNVSAAPGRELYLRVRVGHVGDDLEAEPILARSGLLRSLVEGNGLVRVPLGSEGLYGGEEVEVLLFPYETLERES